MAAFSITHLSLFVIFVALISKTSLTASMNNGSFTASLIHRDSPISPLYNPKNTYFDRLQSSFHRSISRANRFTPNSVSAAKTLEYDIIPGGGEYFMRISIGTPPIEVLVIADTGSDLIWVQCQPCQECYKQKSPIFNPKQSSTYRRVLCETRYCNALNSDMRACSAHGFFKACGYSYSYGDHSFTMGYLATERFIIGSTNNSIQELAFGCGNSNGGNFDEVGSGIVGLGGGSLSLISQLGTKIDNKFSYCLVPILEKSNFSSGKIVFGDNSFISGSDTYVSTPLVSKEPETFYYLTLEAISVGNERLAYENSRNDGNVEKGNIIIDSGTTLTFLDSKLYNKLELVLEKAVEGERVSDPNGIFRICFRDKIGIELPIITVHFTDADVELKPINTFAKAEEDLLCFTMIPSNGIAIFGNLAQMNFLVGYDLDKNSVSFMPTDCSGHS